MFEPIHGSAPKYAGKNSANPLAAICAVGMLLDHVGEPEAAHGVEEAVRRLLTSGKVKSLSAGHLPTDRLGDMVVEELRAGVKSKAPKAPAAARAGRGKAAAR
jgi:3-isopropylmalate dehydrogenase